MKQREVKQHSMSARKVTLEVDEGKKIELFLCNTKMRHRKKCKAEGEDNNREVYSERGVLTFTCQGPLNR